MNYFICPQLPNPQNFNPFNKHISSNILHLELIGATFNDFLTEYDDGSFYNEAKHPIQYRKEGWWGYFGFYYYWGNDDSYNFNFSYSILICCICF